jgi:hypothetical protein
MAENEALKAAMEETASRTECRVYICFALFVVILFLVDKLLATTKKARRLFSLPFFDILSSSLTRSSQAAP